MYRTVVCVISIQLSHWRDNEVECVVLVAYHILRQWNVSPRVDATQSLLYQIEAKVSLVVGLQVARVTLSTTYRYIHLLDRVGECRC